jgi:hypothetical protein
MYKPHRTAPRYARRITRRREDMPKYSVIITRDITESTVIEVEANNPEHAEEVALDTLLEQENTEWEIDDGSWNNSETYVTDVSEE